MRTYISPPNVNNLHYNTINNYYYSCQYTLLVFNFLEVHKVQFLVKKKLYFIFEAKLRFFQATLSNFTFFSNFKV